MPILQILIICLAAFLTGALVRERWRIWILLATSISAIYWLQPYSPLPHFDFWLPSISVALAVFIWAVTQGGHSTPERTTWITTGIVSGVILLIGFLQYLGPLCCLTSSRPPGIFQILLFTLLVTSIAGILFRTSLTRPALIWVFLVFLLVIFIVLKIDPLATWISTGLRTLSGRATATANALDLRWLGFSYIAFRLLHVLRDRQNGRLPEIKLNEFLTYIFFCPTLTAGPIDRCQRFIQDLRKPFIPSAPIFLQSAQRISWGLFKKFVLADSLAILALNDVKASQTASTAWLWVLVYAYTLRIYFDFSGYTDIALGLGQLVGIKLPENFDQPYLKPNLTSFWNSWHMTLAQWFRAYFFNPLTRALRTRKHPFPMFFVILIGQLTTMVLIGLWHGITWNFMIWGTWHGMGLFIHNRWGEFIKIKFPNINKNVWLNRITGIAGIFITFHFVALGWVWFALSDPAQSWLVINRLFGYGR